MTPLLWYQWLLHVWYRLVAWSPVVIRRGKLDDLYAALAEHRWHAKRALAELEFNAEDGIHAARSHLYGSLSIPE